MTLQKRFGAAELLMELDLNQRTRLAQANIETVKASLLAQGFYLQLPPERSVEKLLNQQFNS